jgi:hypothetical protein
VDISLLTLDACDRRDVMLEDDEDPLPPDGGHGLLPQPPPALSGKSAVTARTAKKATQTEKKRSLIGPSSLHNTPR